MATKSKFCPMCGKKFSATTRLCPSCDKKRKAKGYTIREALYVKHKHKSPKHATEAEIKRAAQYELKSARMGGKNKDLEKTRYIYVLELSGGYWYVGQTTDPDRRLKQHMSGRRASEWTKKHPPVKRTQLIRFVGTYAQGEYLEDQITLAQMRKHGDSKVRGGHFCVVDSKKNAQLVKEYLIHERRTRR